MRASHLAPDRADIGDAVKNLAKRMQSPKQVDMARLKRSLKGRPRLVQVLRRGQHHAGGWWTATALATRSADGPLSGRSFSSVMGFSSGANEYCAISAGACAGFGIQGKFEDWHVPSKVKVASDSSAARGLASRRSTFRPAT
eukprot:4344258-Pyramimonas_sp.AAC.1